MVGHLIALNSCVNVRLLSDDKKRTEMGWTCRESAVYEAIAADM